MTKRPWKITVKNAYVEKDNIEKGRQGVLAQVLV